MPVSVISWNTAGWAPTHKLICEHYGSLAAYLDRLQCDVFCIQETKIPRAQLTHLDEKLGARSSGWQSYWAFNTGGARRNMNGVATFVRDSCMVRSATQVVLQDKELDDEGRCLLTDHGAWSIINVYAPYVSSENGPEAAKRKVRFMRALQHRMQQLRAAGQHVMVVGDLNLTWRAQDCKVPRQVLRIDADGAIEGCSNDTGDLRDLAGTWCKVREVSQRLKVPEEVLAGLKTGPTHLALEEEAVTWFQDLLSEKWVDVFASVHPSAQERFTSWNQMLNLRYGNNGTRLDYMICDRAAWDEGLVVRSCSTQLPGGNPVAGIKATSSEAALHAATNFGKWHSAATSGAAKGDGLTNQTDNMGLNNSQFPSTSYTGMVYTPPSYSDHIAVSLLLEGTLSEVPTQSPASASVPVVGTKSETRSCQPWAGQSSLASFFGAKRQKLAGGS